MIFEFNVNEQTLTRTDTSKAVTDSVGYLKAKFTFNSTDWDNTIKSAIFRGNGLSYTVLLDDSGECTIPYETLIRGAKDFINLSISVFGVNGDYRITTNSKTIRLDPSGYTPGETPADPPPDVYAEILNHLKDADAKTHNHDNKSTLDKLSEDNGSLLYNGSPIGGSTERETAVYTYDFVNDYRMFNTDGNVLTLYITDEESTEEEKSIVGKEIVDIEFKRSTGEWVSIKNASEIDFSPYILIINHIMKTTIDDLDCIAFVSIYCPLGGWLKTELMTMETQKIRITYFID